MHPARRERRVRLPVRRSSRGEWSWLLPAAVALVLQLLVLAEGHRDPTFYHPVIDAGKNHREALLISWGLPLPHEPYWQPPLQLYLLAAAYAVSGGSILFAKLLQAVMGAASCALLARLGERVFDRRTGMIAGLLLAASGPFLFYNLQFLPTGLSLFLDLVAIELAIRASEAPSGRRWLACGLAMGVSALALPNVLLFGVALMLAPLAGFRRRAAAIAAGVVIAILPVAIRNVAVSGEVVPISYNGGCNLWLGNNPNATATIAARPGLQFDRLLALPAADGRGGPSASQGWYLEKVGRYVASDPGGFLLGLARKAVLFVNAREIPRNEDPYASQDDSTVLRLLLWRWGSFGFPFGVVLPFAALGIAAGGAASRPRRLVLLFIVLYSLSVIAFFVSSRHRLPVAALLGIFAARGLVWLAGKIRRRELRGAAAGLALVVATGALVNLPVAAPGDGFPYRAETQSALAGLTIIEGDWDRGERLYERAIEMAPAWSEPRLRLGAIHELRGDTTRAMADYRAALAIDPASAEALLHVGMLLDKEGNVPAAIEDYRKAIAAWPGYLEAHKVLAYALASTGADGWLGEARTAWRMEHGAAAPIPDPGDLLLDQGPSAAALRAFRDRVRERFDDLPAQVGFARALTRIARERGAAASGRELSAAIEICRSVIASSPSMVEARRALADALLASGRAGEAERAYAEAIRLKPDDASTHLGWAAASMQSGDIAAAERELTRAIALDPTLAEAYQQLGVLLHGRGEPERAARYLFRAAQLRGFPMPVPPAASGR